MLLRVLSVVHQSLMLLLYDDDDDDDDDGNDNNNCYGWPSSLQYDPQK